MSKVLIAEDDLMIADMIEKVLVDAGYEVCGITRTVGQEHRDELADLERFPEEGNWDQTFPPREVHFQLL
jgi:DNA-binding response OmpR family regulator